MPNEAVSSPAFTLNQRTVIVPEYDLPTFHKTLEKLNAKAAAFGLTPIKLLDSVPALFDLRRIVDPVYEDRVQLVMHRLKPGQKPPFDAHLVRAFDITLEYPIVKLGDWQVMAQVEPLGDSNLVFAIDGGGADADHIESHRHKPILCEHCNASRARKLAYLLKETSTGSWKQVGSTCLKDFTGIDPAAALFLAKMCQMVRAGGDDGEYFSRSPKSISTLDFLTRVWFLVERTEFVSSAKARDTGAPATYDDALNLATILEKNAELGRAFHADHSRFEQQAEQVIAWYTGREVKDSFDQNVKALLAQPALLRDRKHLAFVAAAVPAYLRHLQYLAAQKAAQENPSKHIGAPKEKMNIPLAVHRVFAFSSDYGRAYIIALRDSAGNHLSWRTAAPPEDLLKADAIGRQFDAQFKVKKHGDYKGSAVTEVTHLKLKAWLDQPAAAA